MHHNKMAPNFEIMLDLLKDIKGDQETHAPSLKELLDVLDSPFSRSLWAQMQISQQANGLNVSSSGSGAGGSPCFVPPQRSKAQRMGLLLGALQSCMPSAMRLLVATKQETAVCVCPVQCCNVDCKGSMQSGVIWCPHCLGLVWCHDCVSSPSCRVHCSKCSRQTA
ncbi:hypothetical protein DUNSADRAFT_11630 [Dunaliella salina]|nr:hypothetical protein DUNSADRAFT_11630 [Dunaliella salina]KAF5832465.1 hypothetical protein DUNSADRAFT_11630 [Dunaliella salina]KAF5832466.1 hypothetical protein DUNSADRAFT_11630 [Dunaliella salina]|eukprot:KAF5832464.1 hypothetical protein DUNSADRAFT_11630 [Dunaliella salina]